MIETNRFILRKPKITDATSMFNNIFSDEDSCKYLEWDKHESISDTIKYLNSIIDKNLTSYVIVSKEDQNVVGMISTVKQAGDYSSCEIGYVLGPEFWNKGIMSEVAEAYLNELFNHEGYTSVSASCINLNIRSIMLLSKMGFHYSEVKDEKSIKFGEHTKVYYLLTKKEYLVKKQIKNFNEFFNDVVPLYNDWNEVLSYLKNNNYIIDKVSTIDNDNIIVNKNNNYSYIYCDVLCGTRIYNFITKNKYLNKQRDEIKTFVSENKNYVISDIGEPISKVLLDYLRNHNLKISFAESCTGGMLASTFISTPGASYAIDESYVTYAEEAKMRILGVKKETLEKYTVYSKEVAVEMAKGLKRRSNAEVCVSVTGLAGGSSHNKGDGSYDFAIEYVNKGVRESCAVHKKELGTRNEVREKQTNYILYYVYTFLKSIYNKE